MSHALSPNEVKDMINLTAGVFENRILHKPDYAGSWVSVTRPETYSVAFRYHLCVIRNSRHPKIGDITLRCVDDCHVEVRVHRDTDNDMIKASRVNREVRMKAYVPIATFPDDCTPAQKKYMGDLHLRLLTELPTDMKEDGTIHDVKITWSAGISFTMHVPMARGHVVTYGDLASVNAYIARDPTAEISVVGRDNQLHVSVCCSLQHTRQTRAPVIVTQAAHPGAKRARMQSASFMDEDSYSDADDTA